ncbi:uncharacterized protein isoform X2 [Rhodnius prolixus]|uniref:uncharacterized protein isoform X2 n=1 Tax=Rhodnius prolixus TaxID=13249 RepID=UPI003D18CC17
MGSNINMNVQLKKLMKHNERPKREMTKCISEIEMKKELCFLDESLNKLPSPGTFLLRIDMLNIYDIRNSFLKLQKYFEFVSQEAQQFCNAAMQEREKALETAELPSAVPIRADSSTNISILRPEKKPRHNLISLSKDQRSVKDVCENIRGINLVEEPCSEASSSTLTLLEEDKGTFGGAHSFRRDSMLLKSFVNGGPIEIEREVSTAAPQPPQDLHEDLIGDEEALLLRLEELGFSRKRQPPQVVVIEVDSAIEAEAKKKDRRRKKRAPATKSREIKDAWGRKILIVRALDDREVSFQESLLKIPHEDELWPKENIIDRMRSSPKNRKFVTFEDLPPQVWADMEPELTQVTESSDVAEPMEVIPFPEDDLLMAARSPRLTHGLPMILEARPSYGSVPSFEQIPVLEPTRVEKTLMERIEEEWTEHGGRISFTIICPKSETPRMEAASVFHELIGKMFISQKGPWITSEKKIDLYN